MFDISNQQTKILKSLTLKYSIKYSKLEDFRSTVNPKQDKFNAPPSQEHIHVYLSQINYLKPTQKVLKAIREKKIHYRKNTAKLITEQK